MLFHPDDTHNLNGWRLLSSESLLTARKRAGQVNYHYFCFLHLCVGSRQHPPVSRRTSFSKILASQKILPFYFASFPTQPRHCLQTTATFHSTLKCFVWTRMAGFFMCELRSRTSFSGFAFLKKLDSIIKVNAHHILQEQDWLIGQSCGSISGHENREPSFVQTLVVIYCICYRCK